MDFRPIINKTVKIILSFLLGILLLWFLYREQDFGKMMNVIRQGVRYDIILFSLIFGLSANIIHDFR